MKEKVKLTIGMIVKDEELYLEQCLESLRPLMEQVSSELLIADTGSKDQTIEIAKRYTADVFYYKWKDDFAEARNYVLSQASGEWFMQIDADECFDTTESIAEFFNSGEYEKYNDACILIKNYNYDLGEESRESFASRLFRIRPGRTYQGAVHEVVSKIGPIKYLHGFLHHYGYIRKRSSNEQIRNKSIRNLPILLKEIEKNPDDFRLMFHAAQEYVSAEQADEAEELLKRIIQLDSEDINYEYYVTKSYRMLCKLYSVKKQYKQAMETAEEYFDKDYDVNISSLEIATTTADILFNMGDYEKTIIYLNKVLKVIGYLESRVRKGETEYAEGLDVYGPKYQDNLLCQYTLVLQKCKRYREALDKLMEVKGALGLLTVNMILKLWITELEELECYQEAADYYRIMKEGTSGQAAIVKGLIMGLWEINPDIAVRTAELLVMDKTDEFTHVQNLLCKNYYGEVLLPDDMKKVIEELPTETYFEKLIFLAMSNDIEIDCFLEKCTLNQVKEFAHEVYQKNYAVRQGLLKGKFQKEEYKSLKEVLFYAKLREQFTADTRISMKQLSKVFEQYVDEMTFYVESLYRPEMLEEKERGNLPDEYCFVLYAYEALQFRQTGDLGSYVSSLKLAVNACPAKSEIVKRLIEEVEQDIKKQEEADREFKAYGEQVKAIIRDMIKNRNYEAAKQALLAYESVNPSDKDTLELREILGIYPS